GNFKVSLALVPVIKLTLVGDVAAIEPDKLKVAIDRYKEKKLLVTVLEALRTAALMKNQLGDLGFRGVAADVVLSVPPAFDVEFLMEVPLAAWPGSRFRPRRRGQGLPRCHASGETSTRFFRDRP